MKISLILVVSCFFLACTDQSTKKKSNETGSNGTNPPEVTVKPSAVKKPLSGSGLETKIKMINAERDRINQFSNWTDVRTKDVWGTEGVGNATYYYSGSELKMIRFYPDGYVESGKYYLYFLDGGKLICAQLLAELKTDQAITEHSSNNMVAIGNVVPGNSRLFDRVADEEKAIKMDYILTCYFEGDKIFHQELLNMAMNKHGISEIEKEKKRLKEELELLMKAV